MTATPKPIAQPLLTVTDQGRVRTLCLNAPPAHVLSWDMIDALRAALAAAAQDNAVRVIVLASTGRIFCAGHDLREMRQHRTDTDDGRQYYTDLFARCSDMMTAITRSPKPVIAMIDGLATAAGCQLVAACDLAYASDRSRFCTPGVNTGGFCATPMVALSRNVGRKAAMEMLLSGDEIDAEAAREIGLINRVMPADELALFVDGFAQRLAGRSAPAIAAGKRAFHEQVEMPLDQAYAHAGRLMVNRFLTQDAIEGMDSFLEKRPPRWRDR